MSGTYTRASQVVAEALTASGNDPVRAAQIAVEALVGTLGYVRASQIVTEALIGTLGYVRASQVVAEALIGTLGFVRAAQITTEALISTLGFVRVSQVVAEVLVANYEVMMPAIYPTLIGLGYSVIKRPIWNTSVGVAASGRDSRVGLQVNPLYEFDLTYDLLSDGAADVRSTTPSDLKTLMGFFNSVGGGLNSFLFTDPDDNAVTAQIIGTGDGTTTNFTFERTYGGTDGSTTEPVGYLNQGLALNVYVAGVLQAPSSYTILSANYYAQVVKFTAAPASGASITADFSFYYVVRFKDDVYEFEKLMSQIWSLKKLTLRTVRA